MQLVFQRTVGHEDIEQTVGSLSNTVAHKVYNIGMSVSGRGKAELFCLLLNLQQSLLSASYNEEDTFQMYFFQGINRTDGAALYSTIGGRNRAYRQSKDDLLGRRETNHSGPAEDKLTTADQLKPEEDSIKGTSDSPAPPGLFSGQASV